MDRVVYWGYSHLAIPGLGNNKFYTSRSARSRIAARARKALADDPFEETQTKGFTRLY
jgi:hypothetical protein